MEVEISFSSIYSSPHSIYSCLYPPVWSMNLLLYNNITMPTIHSIFWFSNSSYYNIEQMISNNMPKILLDYFSHCNKIKRTYYRYK